ncbi:UDP-glucose 4-epimerase [Arthrobacter sp. UYEF36]
MRIVITGATGHVGTALLKRLQEARSEEAADLELVGVARRVPEKDAAPYRDVEWHSLDVGDPRDQPALEKAFAGADAVVHLAWLIQPNHERELLRRTNVAGTAHVLAAARAAHIVCASSVGAYSPAPKNQRTKEDWTAGGIRGSLYSVDKAAQEKLLDIFAKENPDVVVSRLRPALTFSAGAGSEVGRYFLGKVLLRLVPRKPRLPLLPLPKELIFQAVHADDVADAYWRVLERRAEGAVNIAAEPVINPNALGWVFNTWRLLPLPLPVLRAAVEVSWRLRLQATDGGWIDMAAGAPIMDTGRAHELLGWTPRRSSLESLTEMLDGLGSGQGRQDERRTGVRRRRTRPATAFAPAAVRWLTYFPSSSMASGSSSGSNVLASVPAPSPTPSLELGMLSPWPAPSEPDSRCSVPEPSSGRSRSTSSRFMSASWIDSSEIHASTRAAEP